MEFRFANEEDCGLILSFIRQLAAYEKMSDQVVATEDLLREWACLEWNQPSIDFYRSLGAVPMDEWTTYRLTGGTLMEMTK